MSFIRRDKRPIIVGIDPGTTIGIAILDMDGNFVSVDSDKNLTRGDISKIILEYGSPVIVASDISPLPRMVEKIATSFGAKTLMPEELLTRKEKHRISKNFSRKFSQVWNNTHERDALVAAIYAWKKIRQTMEKVDKRLESVQDIDNCLSDYLKGGLITGCGNNITNLIKRFNSEAF